VIKDPSGPGIEKPRTNNYISDPVKTKATVPALDPVVTSESTPTPAAQSGRKDQTEATNTLKQQGKKAPIELHIPLNPPQPALFSAEDSKPSASHRKSILQTEQEINLLVKDSLQGIYARAIALEAI
jgi:hypothetical protein